MTEHTDNSAGDGSFVGIQATSVYNSNVYQVFQSDPPHRKYEVGVRFMEDGVPTKARELIGEAIARDYDNAEIRFHWALAMFSKRPYRDLSVEDRQRLMRLSDRLPRYANDEWKRGLEVICELLECLDDTSRDTAPVLKELRTLSPRQRDPIFYHLDLVLTGEMKGSLWAEIRQAAEDRRLNRDRMNRMWAYFQPIPIGPRVKEPVADEAAHDRPIIVSGVLAIALGYLGWLTIAHATPIPILAFLVMAAAGYPAFQHGLEWYYRAKRLKVKEQVFDGDVEVRHAPPSGFASKVDASFNRYFGRYLPRGQDREQWLSRSSGIRRALRDEIVELYRESRVGVGRVNWLIRHLASDVRTRWEAGTLREYRVQYRIGSARRAWCLLPLAALIPAAVVVMATAVRTDPLAAVITVLVAFGSGRVAATRWANSTYERRRYAEDLLESEQALTARKAAYQRWWDKLSATRPSDGEMESWLTCDKILLLDEVLGHYRLAWRDIIAYAFLQTPAKSYKRGRTISGPWRYSRYDLLLFLITRDGVREVSSELDFEGVNFSVQERNNFRFDAVASVHVSKTGEFGCNLELTLVNGQPSDVRVTDPDAGEHGLDEDLTNFSEINLAASGFVNTLHILEGIAAEGKSWLDRGDFVLDNR